MNRIGLVFLLLTCIVGLNADSIFWVGMNDGGQLEEFTMTLGFKGEQFGGFLAFGFNSGYSSSDVLDYPCPHSYYTMEDEDARVAGAYGAGIMLFFQTQEPHHAYIGFEMFFDITWDVSRSDATGWLYKEDSSTEVIPGLCFGYMYEAESGFVMGFDLSTTRGIGLMLGKSF